VSPPSPRAAGAVARRRADGKQRSGQLLRQAAHWLDQATAALERPGDERDVPAALDAISEVRRALAHLTRPADPTAADVPAVVRRLQVTAGPESARAARDFCRRTCGQWALPPAVANAVTDLSSELVSNASRSGTGPVVLALELTGECLRVSVYDDGPGRPELLAYRPGLSDRGLGLQLVQHLSDEWGWTDDRIGKWVWARVHLDQGGPGR
jgi:anti-sigma regulatory factor (Ser/Thr protein kinase)